MTHFEAVGVSYQYGATTVSDAKGRLKKSCERCTAQGKHISCAHCAIATAHNDIINFVLRKGN